MEQKNPGGLPEAFLIGEKFIGKDNVALILGDNFFYGQNLTEKLLKCTKLKKGAKVLLHKVINPELFGVAKVNKNNKIVSIAEKPKKFVSDLAITGLYFFDNKVVNYSKHLRPSKRNELEITDLLKIYKTSAFVSAIENRQGFKIGCLEEISLNNNWIGKKEVINAIKFYGKCNYSKYLQRLITKNK